MGVNRVTRSKLMVDKITSNTTTLTKRAILMMLIGTIITGGGISLYVFQLITTPSFGLFIAVLGFIFTLAGVYEFRYRNTYSIELYPEYFIVKKKQKEVKIEKNNITNFYIKEEFEGSRYLRYAVYTLYIEHDGRTYAFEPRKYQNVLEKMCAYYGVTPEEALQKEKGLWELIKDLMIIEEK